MEPHAVLNELSIEMKNSFRRKTNMIVTSNVGLRHINL